MLRRVTNYDWTILYILAFGHTHCPGLLLALTFGNFLWIWGIRWDAGIGSGLAMCKASAVPTILLLRPSPLRSLGPSSDPSTASETESEKREEPNRSNLGDRDPPTRVEESRRRPVVGRGRGPPPASRTSSRYNSSSISSGTGVRELDS